MMADVKIEGMERVSKRLGGLAAFSLWAYDPMVQSTAVIQDAIVNYPEKSQGAFSRLATPGQRRAYWAKVKSGEINHREGIGYVRSGTLGRKWTTQVDNSPGGVRGIVGNNTEYAKYVQSALNQQPFHTASGWKTDNLVFESTRDDIDAIWVRAINKVLSK